MTAEQIRDVKGLSGLRRALYYTARSRGDDHASAFRTASARCCVGGDFGGHVEFCENAPVAGQEGNQ